MTATETLSQTDSFKAARKAMVDSQLRTSGVNAPFVTKRMGEVAREDFVPEAAKSCAYMDRAIDLGDGKMLGAPLVQGMMLQEANPKASDSVLVIDGGSGYLAELLKPLCASVTSVSPEDAVKSSRGKKVDLIIVDGAGEQLPEALGKRLEEDGRIVTGLVDDGITRLASGCKSGKDIALMPLAEIGIPKITAFDAPKGWSF